MMIDQSAPAAAAAEEIRANAKDTGVTPTRAQALLRMLQDLDDLVANIRVTVEEILGAPR